MLCSFRLTVVYTLMKLRPLIPIHLVQHKLNEVGHMHIREVFLPNLLAY